MENLLYALLGWVSGLFSSVLLEWNRDHRQVKSLREALHFEMVLFRYRMGDVVFLLAAKLGVLTPDVVAWLIKEFESYGGPDRDNELLEALRTMKSYPQRAAVLAAQSAAAARQKSLALKKYPTPALDAAIASVSLFTPDEQKDILELRARVANFDAIADEVWHFFQMTFDGSLNVQSRGAVESNIETAYRQALELCREMATNASRLVSAA
jgi:hypothetical protein